MSEPVREAAEVPPTKPPPKPSDSLRAVTPPIREAAADREGAGGQTVHPPLASPPGASSEVEPSIVPSPSEPVREAKRRADIELLREAAEGWPTPNRYTLACDQLQMSFDALLADRRRYRAALQRIADLTGSDIALDALSDSKEEE